jgi:fructokinase
MDIGAMRIGVDLGGTKIEAVALTDTGEELGRQRIATPQGDYLETINSVCGLITELNLPPTTPVGIGIPGTISPSTGLVKNANSTWLIGKPFFNDLQKALDRPLRMANDANCFTMSEAVDGAAAGADCVFGVILGTGVGGGIAVNGKLISGPNAIAGEWGHNPLPWPSRSEDQDENSGAQCYCGLEGCIETFLSGAGLVRSFVKLASLPQGTRLNAKVVAEQSRAGDKSAISAMEIYYRRLAKSLASIINILDLDVIVLGGGLSNIKEIYDRVPDLWSEWIFSDDCSTKLLKNLHGDSGGVRGAAMLWPARSMSGAM